MDAKSDAKKPRKKLGEQCLELGFITSEQLSLALSEQRRSGVLLGEVLVKLGFVTQSQIAEILARELHTEYIDLSSATLDRELLQLIPAEFARQHQLIPLDRDGFVLTVAMADTFDIMSIDEIERMTTMRVEVIAASPQAIHEAIEQNYVQSVPIDTLVDAIQRSGSTDMVDDLRSAPPVVQFVDQIIIQAIQKRATDIHIEPQENVLCIRLRIDGVLRHDLLIPKSLQLVTAARIKIMSGLDVTEHRLPQDGKIHFKLGHKFVDLRVSTLPTQYGESIVLRLLDKSNVQLKLSKLGLAKKDQTLLVEAIEKPHGMILATGPTGSGKTTTLYAALSRMDAVHNSIFTLEDPIEYALPNIRQTQVNSEIGMTFASGLRALLRQDPDVILVGEIRDEETAQLAIRAALTGHLVFSTLHTNSAAGTIPRLVNMGIEPFLLGSTLEAVVAQRLVRKICFHCAEPLPPQEAEKYLKRLGLTPAAGDTFKRGKGCSFCHNNGYLGRIAVYEVLHAIHLKEVTLERGMNESDIAGAACKAGMTTMLEDGFEKARAGTCSLEDLLQIIGS